METRKTVLRELETMRQESIRARDRVLEQLGKGLFEKYGGEELLAAERGDFSRSNKKIADSEDSIRVINEALAAIKNLNEEIAVKKEERKTRNEEYDIAAGRLGRELLEGMTSSEVLPVSVLPAKRQADLCAARIANLNDRLREIEIAAGEGFFAGIVNWFKKISAKSALKKYAAQQEKACREAGRKYIEEVHAHNVGESDIPESISFRDALEISAALAELEGALTLLEEEKRKTEISIGASDNPLRRIKFLEGEAEKSRDEIQGIYRRIGESAASGNFAPQMESEDGATLRALKAEADTFQKAAEGRAREIEKIKDEIALEEKQAELARLEAALARGKNQLAADEKNLSDLNSKIAEINDTINQLAQKIGRDDG